MTELENKIKGSLYGFVIGDAMGATTEFMRAKDIAMRYGQLTEIIGGGWLNLEQGKATDDTDMMMCVANAIMKNENGDIDEVLSDCCKLFIEWYKSNPIDIGGTCRHVIETCIGTFDFNKWYDVANDPERLGNGSLMRTLPSILSGQSLNLSINQGRLTHNNVECDAYITKYYNIINSALSGVKITNHSTYLQKPDPTGRVSNTFNCALHWMYKSKTFEECILKAVNDGGDADTIAAITGSIAGAQFGFNAIPKRWIMQLNKDLVLDIEKLFKYFSKMYVQNTKCIV